MLVASDTLGDQCRRGSRVRYSRACSSICRRRAPSPSARSLQHDAILLDSEGDGIKTWALQPGQPRHHRRRPGTLRPDPQSPARGSAGGRPATLHSDAYKNRNVVERGCNRIKNWRGPAIRYDTPRSTAARLSFWPPSCSGSNRSHALVADAVRRTPAGEKARPVPVTVARQRRWELADSPRGKASWRSPINSRLLTAFTVSRDVGNSGVNCDVCTARADPAPPTRGAEHVWKTGAQDRFA
jgi:hypothetical protein